MKIAYFDCPAGASGDMLLGALLDAGLKLSDLQTRLSALQLQGFKLEARRVQKAGISAIQAQVILQDEISERHLPEIERYVTDSDLPPRIKDQAIAILRRIGEVEAGIHGEAIDAVHLHELGGLDTLVDVTGVLLGLEALGIEQVFASPLPLGRGFVKSAHGLLPLPAPATLALLKGVPITGSELQAELVTPTGAALLAGLAQGWGPIPPMRLLGVGYGAGSRDLPIPNVLRLLLGEAEGENGEVETLELLESNIDDQNPQLYEHTLDLLFQAGALDAWLTSIQMKKNRPGTLLSILCRPGDTERLASIVFQETTSLGVRQQKVQRKALQRAMRTVETPYGPVRVKLAWLPGGGSKFSVEYEDCRLLAQKQGVPLREVMQAAERIAHQSLSSP
jgi:pyridinium-3,5-bisthiocarboxylic acid mononucleotide nickel chelatase